MEIYSLPDPIRGIVFDIDKTLYDDDAYAAYQIDLLVERLAKEWNTTADKAQEAVDQWRSDYAATHDGAQQSLGNTFAGLGIPIQTSVAWREELIAPGEYLERDDQLIAALGLLAREFALIALTNNPRTVGERSLAALGVADLVRDVVGLDTTWASKPSPEPFSEASRRLGFEAAQVVSVGDRYDVDIAPALSIGMGGILVAGVAEVYALPRILL